MTQVLMAMIKEHEGFRSKPYLCSEKKLTIGYGRNLSDVGLTKDEMGMLGGKKIEEGISKREAEVLLDNDVERATQDIKSVFPQFDTFSTDRKNALTDMMFNLGKTRFSGFSKMIEAINTEDWEKAYAEAKNSKWHNQVGNRAVKIEKLLLMG